MLDKTGTVLKAVGMSLARTVNTSQEFVELTIGIRVLGSHTEAACFVRVVDCGTLDSFDLDDLGGGVGAFDVEEFENV